MIFHLKIRESLKKARKKTEEVRKKDKIRFHQDGDSRMSSGVKIVLCARLSFITVGPFPLPRERRQEGRKCFNKSTKLFERSFQTSDRSKKDN